MAENAPMTDPGPLGLAERFPPASLERWRERVVRDLAGAPTERLVTRTLDDLEVQPLYTREDLPDPDAAGFPGAPPYTRGDRLLGNAPRGWGIVQEVWGDDLAAAAAAAREEVEGGATGLLLRLGPGGLPAEDVEALDRLLERLPLAEVELFLDAGGAFGPAAALLSALWQRRGYSPETARGGFGADPLGALARDGRLPRALPAALAELGALGAWTDRTFSWVAACSVGSHPYHDAGASRPQELGFAVATGLEYLRALTAAGLDLRAAARQITFSLSVDAELFAEVAKLRALRRLWGRALELCARASGGPLPERGPAIHARSAARMLTARDPWVNVLRATTAGFAAAVGGASRITLSPFDAAARTPSAAARRLARNTQTILQLESQLHRVIDPAGGAYAIEAQTEALARAGWEVLQAVERAGGMGAALASGWVRAEVDAVAERRARAVARRKQAIVGVSEFPLQGEPPLPAEPPAPRRLPQVARAAAQRASLWDSPDPQEALRAAFAGATLAAAPQDGARVEPLPLRRLAAPFEALRARSDAWRAARGAAPRVFLASLGPLAEHGARTAWITNLLAAGGVEAVAPSADGWLEPQAAATAFSASGASEAIVCGTDARYAELLAALVPALRAAGARRVTVAGAPGEREAADRAAGVDGWVHLGQDVLAFLVELVDRLCGGEARS